MKNLPFLHQVEERIYYVDPLKLGSHSVSGVYLIVADGITLVEIGTSTNVPYILEAVRAVGHKENDVRRAIVTHVHLDHSGGAGNLIKLLPHMRVHVHERGLGHLADPTKLLQSAQMVYGNPETIAAIHGEVLPVPKENLVPVLDDIIDIGSGMQLHVFDGPGHAPHHLCVFEPQSGCLFSGEALGHYHPDSGILLPAVAPPGFDLKASLDTIQKIGMLKPRIICFSQFGQHRDAAYILKEAKALLTAFGDRIRRALDNGVDNGDIIEVLQREVADNPSAQRFSEESIRGMLMSIVLGYYCYFQRTGFENGRIRPEKK
jgi:glyoxylase-like metal-dependent hydrolase (beta-lactamase superfamily II)